jgi:hypothetical protein
MLIDAACLLHGHKFYNPSSKQNSKHAYIRLAYKYIVLFSLKNCFLIGSWFQTVTPIISEPRSYESLTLDL